MKRSIPILLVLALVAAACSRSDDQAGTAPTTAVSVSPGAVSDSTSTTVDPGVSYAGTTPAPEFPEGLDWLNTAEPLSLQQLRGKVVLLDFWTYGCINCIHVIPDLKRLEAEFPDELVVIGVHSAKFVNEAETENIREVVLRYEVEHPVVNDRDFEVWRSWGANAWPTTVLIDPAGNVVGSHAGEGVYDIVQPFVAGLVNEFSARGELDPTPIVFELEADGRPNTVLSYPGKVFVTPDGDTLYIADSGHHRIVAADPDSGDVLDVYGGGTAGLVDGRRLEARFNSPQGMALSPDGSTLYVADTGNHAVRAIDLSSGSVTTVLGTGLQGWPPTGGIGTDVSINSPWALEERNGDLYLAMAGSHQIWVMDLASQAAAPLVGNARESTFNGPLAEAELAQPSGLAFDSAGLLYFADSESSAIRSAEVDPIGVTDVVAGSDENLFDFGDVDGAGTDARLQHPLGLAYADDGFLYVADTYNSKIKRIDLAAGAVETFAGGEQGWADGSSPQFYEPGGLAVHGGTLFVADTNNHAVRMVDLASGETGTLVLSGIEAFAPPPEASDYAGEIVESAGVLLVGPGPGFIELAIDLPPDHKVNGAAPSSAEFSASGAARFPEAVVSLTGAEFPVRIPVEFTDGMGSVTVDLTVIYCHEETESLCLIQQLRFIADVAVEASVASNDLTLSYAIELPDL